MVIVASLATSAAGLSPIVGALLAGLLIAETEYHSEVEVITAPFKGLALGVFLITVGMSLDLETLIANWADFVLALSRRGRGQGAGDVRPAAAVGRAQRRPRPKPAC